MKAATILAALAIALVSGHAFAADPLGLTPKFSIYADEKEVGINRPEGVACNDKMLVVADSGNGRLIKYPFKDSQISGGTEVKLPQLPYPFRVQISSKGEILALDGREHRIVRLGPDGDFKGNIEPQGLPFPGAAVPVSFKLDQSDNIYMLDIFSGSVLELDQAGKFIRQIPVPRTQGFFTDICVDSKGTVYLVDAVAAMVYSAGKEAKDFAPLTKTLKEYMNFPIYIALDARGDLLLVDQDGGGIIVLGQDGSFLGRQLSMGWSEGLLYYPAQMCLGTKGEVFVADRGNNRVQAFAVTR